MEDAKNSTRIYVASVHPDISEADLRSVFQAFGEIVQVQLAKQHSGQGHRWDLCWEECNSLVFRGFGYIEYKDMSSATSAIKGMACFNLGGQILQVGNCVTPADALSYIIPTASTASIGLSVPPSSGYSLN